jgi:Fe-S cluster assembly protein SufD
MTTATATPFPSTRQEAWRYTPVEEIVERVEAAARAVPPPSLSREIVDALAGDHGGTRLVFVNGAYDAAVSDCDGLPVGLSYVLDERRTDLVPEPPGLDGFLARNRRDGRDTAVITVEPGAVIDRPVHIVHLWAPNASGPTTISHPRTVITVGESSHVAVIETYCGLDGPAVTNADTTIRIGRGAEVEHCRVESEARTATHIGHTRIEQQEGSRFRMTSVTLGGDIARNAVDVRLDGADARAELCGVNVTTGHQRHDTSVTIDHAASGGASTQRFTGVVDEHGKGSFSGEIVVRPGTVATDAHQSNRNLVLSPDAEADTRPWLQILADDVRCTHGATVGRLDEDALFYLRTRGIPLGAARQMLIDAFVRDITDTIPDGSLREHVVALIAARSGAGADARAQR